MKTLLLATKRNTIVNSFKGNCTWKGNSFLLQDTRLTSLFSMGLTWSVATSSVIQERKLGSNAKMWLQKTFRNQSLTLHCGNERNQFCPESIPSKRIMAALYTSPPKNSLHELLLLFVFFAPLTELGYMNPIITFVFKIGCPK